MWGYYARPHSFVSSRETEKGSMLRVPLVNDGCHPYVHGHSKAPESFNFAKLVALPGLRRERCGGKAEWTSFAAGREPDNPICLAAESRAALRRLPGRTGAHLVRGRRRTGTGPS